MDKANENDWKEKLKRLCGISLFLLGAFFNSLNYLIASLVTDISTFELIFYKNLIQALMCILLQIYVRKPFLNKENNENLLAFVRAFSIVSRSALTYFSFHHMPMGESAVIVRSSSVFCGFFAWLILREAYGVFEIITSLTTVAGIVFIAQPEFLFTKRQQLFYNSSEHLLGSISALTASLIGSFTFIIGRKLKEAHQITILLYNSIYGSIISAGLCFIVGDWTIPSLMTSSKIVGLAVASFLNQFCNLTAIKMDNASVGSIISSSTSVFSLIFQLTIYHQIPNIYSAIGCSLVMFCAAGFAIRKLVTKKDKVGDYEKCNDEDD